MHIKGLKCWTSVGQIAHPMPIGSAWAQKAFETSPIFRGRAICFVKKEKQLDLQVFSRLGKAMNILQ